MADTFSNVKLGPESFVDLAVSHLVTEMFPIKKIVDKPFFDLYSLSLDEHLASTLINKDVVDDESFGKSYILFGTFQMMSLNGYIVVLPPSAVKNQFVSKSAMQLIVVKKEGKTYRAKLTRRIPTSSKSFVVSEYLSFNVFSTTVLITKGTKISIQFSTDYWNNSVGNTGFTPIYDTNTFLKRKRVTLISEDTAASLLEGSDRKPSSSSSSSGKKFKNLLKGATSIYTDVKATKLKNNAMANLREEAISLVEDAFSESISPEDFVAGYLELKSHCDNRFMLGAISANILMDATFRISDCSSLPNDSIITKAGIDVDQFVIKFNFDFVALRDRNKKMDCVQNNVMDFSFLKIVYDSIEDILKDSINETTTFSSELINQAQSRKGSSLDTALVRSHYTSLCTGGISSQTLNISFKSSTRYRDDKENKVDLFNASVFVIKFLLEGDTYFNNSYSAERLRAYLINGQNESLETFYAPGGLLFPFLTLAFIAYQSPCPITIIIESYGGKSRGKHVHWNFAKTDPEEIKKIIKEVKEAEERKIPFTIKNTVKALSTRFPAIIKIKSIKWGIGCDAKGSTLLDGDSSFLVCQPLNISEIDYSRRNRADGVFRNINMSPSTNKLNLSRVTRAAASNSLDADSDSDNNSVEGDNDPVRYRWFSPKRFKNHSRYVPFCQLCPFNLHNVTHVLKKGDSIENELLSNNPTLRRVQNYSPNLRSLHGKKGLQKLGEDLMDIRTFIKTAGGKSKSYIDNNIARDKTAKWISKASEHIDGIRKNGGMARLELTFESKDFDSDDKEFDKNIETIIKSFVESTKIYSGNLVADLAEISLLSFEGISNSLLLWFTNDYILLQLSHNVFAEVWQYLTYFAKNFFSGRRCFETKAYFAPRLGYLFSRPLLNPSWNGINEAMLKVCGGQINMEKLKTYWYKGSKMQDNKSEIASKMNSSLIKIESEFSTGVNAFLDLLTTNCQSNNASVIGAIACSCCKRITSKQNLKTAAWKNHLCFYNNGIEPLHWDLHSPTFDSYLKELNSKFTESQSIACQTIIATNDNFFLTGVAGSGKSYVLNFVYPTLIRIYGYTGVSLTATTNIASTHINGTTLYHFLGLRVSPELDKQLNQRGADHERFLFDHIKRISNHSLDVFQNAELCKVVIVDEAGMCGVDLFFFLNKFLQKINKNMEPFGGVRIILVGDILQLAPVVDKDLGCEGQYFFQDEVFEDNFSIAYLRENHRQEDPLFLEALNKVRIGDVTVVEYLNKIILKNNITSQETLIMAASKSLALKNNMDHNAEIRRKINHRIKSGYIYENRNDHSYFNEKNYKDRLTSAPKTDFSDFIVCQEHLERTAYIECKKTVMTKYRCDSTGTEHDYRLPSGLFKSIEKKLPKILEIYIGMPCRVTYKTGNPNICANTLVIIEVINVDMWGKVRDFIVKTTSPVHETQYADIVPIEISEEFKGTVITRKQFPINSAIGLLPWHLQCLTISENIFYDNTRCTSGYGNCAKGSFYTVMSRVKKADQFCFLYEVTEKEISHGVDDKAKRFDDRYRLSEDVIFLPKKNAT